METTAAAETIVEEKTLDPKVRNLWLKALSAVELRNYKYAVTMLQQVITQEPAFLEGRKMLREAAVQLRKGVKKGLFSSTGFSLMKVQGSIKKDPRAALSEIEKVLEKDPYNMQANQALHDAAMRIGMTKLGSFALETIRKGHPENTRNLHQLAEHYMKHDEPESAGEVYKDIVRRDPTDMDAAKGEKDASARSSMKKGKWDSASGMKDLQKDEEESQALEEAGRAAMTYEQMENKLADLAEHYEENPNNLGIVKQIATLYEKMEKFEEAVSYYDWAHKLSDGDVALERRVAILKEKVGDLELRRLREEIEENPDAPDVEEKQAAFDKIRKERSSELVGEAQKRVDRNPTDKQLRFELGQHLYNSDQYTEAIPQLQQAKSNPHLRTRSMLLLGRCFERKEMFDLAETQLKEAAEDLTAMDNTKKEILYELGLVYEKMGDKVQALDCMKEIYNADYGYRDVAKRVEQSYTKD